MPLPLIALATLCLPAAGWSPRSTQGPEEGDLTELSLEELLAIEIVTSASKVEQTTFEAPGSVTIVTAHEIEVHGYRTLADILRNEHVGVRGFGPPDLENDDRGDGEWVGTELRATDLAPTRPRAWPSWSTKRPASRRA